MQDIDLSFILIYAGILITLKNSGNKKKISKYSSDII